MRPIHTDETEQIVLKSCYQKRMTRFDYIDWHLSQKYNKSAKLRFKTELLGTSILNWFASVYEIPKWLMYFIHMKYRLKGMKLQNLQGSLQ